jgi:hypothetical protein
MIPVKNRIHSTNHNESYLEEDFAEEPLARSPNSEEENCRMDSGKQ